MDYNSVAAWRNRYKSHGLAVLEDAPRSGRPIRIEGQQRAQITALACSKPPQGHARWSLRLLADKAVELGTIESISHDGVRTILKKRSPAAPEEDLVHRSDQQPLRGPDGAVAAAVQPALQPASSGGVLR